MPIPLNFLIYEENFLLFFISVVPSFLYTVGRGQKYRTQKYRAPALLSKSSDSMAKLAAAIPYRTLPTDFGLYCKSHNFGTGKYMQAGGGGGMDGLVCRLLRTVYTIHRVVNT